LTNLGPNSVRLGGAPNIIHNYGLSFVPMEHLLDGRRLKPGSQG